MMRLAILLSLALASALPALADDCQKDIAAVDKALQTNQQITPEQRAQVEDMRNQAVQLCGAGNEQEGVDVISEAKAMLAIE